MEKCREYIYEGDAFQVVISQRMSLPFEAAPLDLYRALRTLNPSPYMYYLDLGDFHIAGASPEILVRLEEGEVTVRPIAGTRRRGENDAQDKALAAELLSDPKELAEHLMLIDLGRNDVGRIARIGTVKVTDKMTIEKYSHVMHIASNVSGRLADQLDAIDVLKATFPAGTLSGAPKVRAMEIIEDLEPDKRGIYSGAVGYIGWNGNMDTAIAIRTALIKAQTVHLQVGAGIVADSNPASEWEETMNKGRAVLRAVALARAGLHQPLDREPAAGELEAEGKLTVLAIIDNYDSFTYNLVQYFGELDQAVTVIRNDQKSAADIEQLAPAYLVISPGPCTPNEAGVSVEAVQRLAGRVPVMGVCLGHQCIGQAFGGRVVHAQRLMHGKTSMIHHNAEGVFRGLPSPFQATRYHSLALEASSLPDCFEVTAWTEDDEIMAIRHLDLAAEGVQFHPESLLTQHGHALLKNFLGGVL